MARVEPIVTAAAHPFPGERFSVPEKVVVSPVVGQFRPAPPETITAEGEVIGKGQIVGYVDAQGETIPVRSAFTGWLMGLLVHEGERVREGQPIAWLRAL